MNRTCALLLALPLLIGTAVAQSLPADSEIVARISAATILILAGEGAGRLNAISTGVIVRPYGVILTAYHGIKNAREVQVRLHTGDVYDQVVLIGTDERRDVAALKISARHLTTLPLGSGAEMKPAKRHTLCPIPAVSDGAQAKESSRRHGSPTRYRGLDRDTAFCNSRPR